MRTRTKNDDRTKSRHAGTRRTVRPTRLTDLLGDFSEQTGAQFG